MSPTSRKVELSEDTVRRLQAHAMPLVDTFDSVIVRLIDAYEDRGAGTAAEQMFFTNVEVEDFDPFAPPDLTHTKILTASFNGRTLESGATHWNGLLNEAVRTAAKMAATYEELRRLISVNFLVGEKHDEGYRHLADVNISVQGQDSNAAWRAAAHVAHQTGLPVNVIFLWRRHQNAAFPGKSGQFRVSGSTEGGAERS